MLDIQIDLNKYNITEVLKNDLDYQYMLILDYIHEAIKSKKLSIQKDEKGHTYYVINFPAVTSYLEDITSKADNTLRKVKVLDEKKYLSLLMGKFNDSIYGYTRTAVRLNKKFNNLLREDYLNTLK